ncbi:hypothetical protein ACH3VR_10695 [Microbacterium sp. B2969]|uniref:Uncharacterized protein n=1 Tax=Microbacterium alkaliflavum TaxID=3248839 RepID=A0ABW7Q7L8_9MICO
MGTSGAPGAFWGAVAQIAPVLALTLVLEARVAVKKWHDATPKSLKVSQGIVYGLAGLGAVVVMQDALQRLVNSDQFGLAPTAVLWIVGGVAGIVILGPVVTAFADPYEPPQEVTLVAVRSEQPRELSATSAAEEAHESEAPAQTVEAGEGGPAHLEH